jgi:hypothetical protein
MIFCLTSEKSNGSKQPWTETSENEEWEAAARNSQISIVLTNGLIKSTQILLSLL